MSVFSMFEFGWLCLVLCLWWCPRCSSGLTGKCYKTAAVPFADEAAAQDWVDTYCECPEEFAACNSAAEIKNLWKDMVDADTVAIVDGYTYPSWNAYEAQQIKAHKYMEYSTVHGCNMTAHDTYSVTIVETIVVALDVHGHGASGNHSAHGSASTATGKPVTYVWTRHIQFTDAGIFASKDESSTGNVGLTMLEMVDAVGAADPVAGASTVPMTDDIMAPDSGPASDSEPKSNSEPKPNSEPKNSFLEIFLQHSSSTVIIWLGFCVLSMYLALLFCLVKVTSLCLSRCSATGTADSSSDKQHRHHRIATDSSLFSSTTDVETALDMDDKL